MIMNKNVSRDNNNDGDDDDAANDEEKEEDAVDAVALVLSRATNMRKALIMVYIILVFPILIVGLCAFPICDNTSKY